MNNIYRLTDNNISSAVLSFCFIVVVLCVFIDSVIGYKKIFFIISNLQRTNKFIELLHFIHDIYDTGSF